MLAPLNFDEDYFQLVESSYSVRFRIMTILKKPSDLKSVVKYFLYMYLCMYLYKYFSYMYDYFIHVHFVHHKHLENFEENLGENKL